MTFSFCSLRGVIFDARLVAIKRLSGSVRESWALGEDSIRLSCAWRLTHFLVELDELLLDIEQFARIQELLLASQLGTAGRYAQ
jgi:hypothetical protein